MAKSLPVGQPLGYLGIKEVDPPEVYEAARAPLVTDYRYDTGDVWIDTSNVDIYMLAARSGSTATWLRFEESLTFSGNNGLEATNVAGTVTFGFTPIAVGYTGSQREYAQNAIQTTDATVTDIVSIVLAEGEMISLEARINAYRDDYTEALVAKVFTGAFREPTGNVTVLNSNLDIFENSAGAPTVEVAADVVNQTLDIIVTGEVGKNIFWVATYEYNKLLSDA